MRRREFITLIGGAAAWPFAAHAQQTDRMRRIGVLMMYAETDVQVQGFIAAFGEALAKLGWKEGHNLRTEYRWATSDRALIQRSAKELVALQPDLILSSSTPTTAVLQQETRTIPIIFANIVDPVGSGFVSNLSKPGGNITGFINFEFSMGGKWLELLKEIAPRVTRVAALVNPGTAPYADKYLSHFSAAAQAIGVTALTATIRDAAEFETVIAAQAREPNSGIILIPDGFMLAHHAGITALAGRYGLPAVYFFRSFAETGGLMSYGNDLVDNYRRAASYVDRILKGESPSGLPVQVPVKFELVINLKTARALGLDVPWILQQRADEVIE